MTDLIIRSSVWKHPLIFLPGWDDAVIPTLEFNGQVLMAGQVKTDGFWLNSYQYAAGMHHMNGKPYSTFLASRLVTPPLIKEYAHETLEDAVARWHAWPFRPGDELSPEMARIKAMADERVDDDSLGHHGPKDRDRR